MTSARVFADFHNADPQGRLCLNCNGTAHDLSNQGIQLSEGLRLLFYGEELEVYGTVSFSEAEDTWVGIIDWKAIRNSKDEPVSVVKSA